MKLNISIQTVAKARADLTLPPVSGMERLGLSFARYASTYNTTTIVATEYIPLPENAYVAGHHAPVSFDSRWLMQQSATAAQQHAGIFLVHLHEHRGKPWFSPIDMRTNRDIIRPIALIEQTLPTGALLLSIDSAAGLLARSDGLIRLDIHEVPA